MGREVLVFDVDARDLRRAFERRALAIDGQLGFDLVELPLERPGEVGNLEVDPRVNGVEVPGTGGNSQNRRAHRLAPLVLPWIYLQLQGPYRIGGCICKYLRHPISPGFSLGSWQRSCRAGSDWTRGIRSCGHTPPSCATSRSISRRRRDSRWRTSTCSLSWRAPGVSYA